MTRHSTIHQRSKDIYFGIGMAIVLMGGVLGFIPVSLPFRALKIWILESIIIGGVALFLKNIWFRLFLLWCLITVVYWAFQPGTTKTINVEMTMSLYLIGFSLIFCQLLSENLTLPRIKILLNIICVIAILQAVMMVLQKSGVFFMVFSRVGVLTMYQCKDYFIDTPFRLSIYQDTHWIKNFYPFGFLSNPNMAASLLALSFPAFLRKRWVFFIPLIGFGLYLSWTLGGIVPVATIIFIYAMCNKRLRIWAVTCLLIALSAYFLRCENFNNVIDFSGRTPLWKYLITQVFPQHWGMGIGLEQFKSMTGDIYRAIGGIVLDQGTLSDGRTWVRIAAWFHVHNEYLTVLIETGLVGFLIVCGYVASIFIRMRKGFSDNVSRIVCFGVLTGLMNCFVNFLLHTSTCLIFIVYLSIFEWQRKKCKVLA